ncbi:polysaccharide deacetylase family protein [Carboxylicivirga sp. M1479]|uniref:polysaccharide deacetylase family protein n=1 Tax=Carboxylicivirga sp. M1479 TaxID=2594476 RepID=UPI00163DA43E|nr:polysaccharide deacetylase family protein [Carboxylicivirga sp. M1479]
MKPIIILTVILLVQVRLAYSQNLLLNPGFETALVSTEWKKASLTGGDGNVSFINGENVNYGNQACQLTCTLSNANFGAFGLKSHDYATQSKVFTAKMMVKTDAEGLQNNLGFKIQIVGTITGGDKKYFASQEFKLTEEYQEFTYTKDASSLGFDFKQVRVMLQCAGYKGNYFFDDAVLDDGTTEEEITIVPAAINPITKISTTDKIVAFTFDDGPHSTLSLQLAELFNQYNGKATFFNVGDKLMGNEEIVTELLKQGHEIGNHSMSHARVPDLEDDAAIYNEIMDMQNLYASTFDYHFKLFRAPFLDYGQLRNNDTVTPEEDYRVGGVLESNQLIPINAKVYSGDSGADANALAVLTKIHDGIVPGAIILCHERSHTLEALRSLMPTLVQEGYRFVTVSDLLRYEEGWDRIAATHEKIIIEGANYISNSNSELILHRHSDAIYNNSTQENLFNSLKARSSSGILVKFKTSSPQINARFRIREGNVSSSTFGVFQNNALSIEQTYPYNTNDEIIIPITSHYSNEEVEYMISLPLWTDASFIGLELETDYELVQLDVENKPVYVAYGNSITHGRGQNGTYETYPFIVSRQFDWTLYNLAVGGGKTSQKMAEMIRDDFGEIDVLTVLIGFNDFNGEGVSPEIYQNRLINFLSTVREKHTDTRIFCITMTHTTVTVSEKSGATPELFRNVMKNVVSERNANGDTQLYLIEGDKITSEQALNDAVHLNIEGAADFAEQLFLQMKAVIDNDATAIDSSGKEVLSVFPNPCSGKVHLRNVKVGSLIHLHDVNGYQLKTIMADKSNMDITISELTSGYLFVSYSTEKGWMTEKVLKI